MPEAREFVDSAALRFVEFFTVNIRNRTRAPPTPAPPPCFCAGAKGRGLPGCRT
jgi:hypothetical protein